MSRPAGLVRRTIATVFQLVHLFTLLVCLAVAGLSIYHDKLDGPTIVFLAALMILTWAFSELATMFRGQR